MAALMIFIPIAELGATGSYARMAGVIAVLVVMASLGWIERDNTMRDVIDAVFDDVLPKAPNQESSSGEGNVPSI